MNKLFEFIEDWIMFVQISSEISRKHKKWMDPNEIIGIILLLEKGGISFSWQDVYEVLLFLKTTKADEISETEMNSHKVFISRYLHNLINKKIIRSEESEDKRMKKYFILDEAIQIINEIKQEVNTKKFSTKNKK